MTRQHKAPQYNVACAECMKIHPSSSISGLQKEAEERIAKESQNIDHERSFMNLTIHGLDVFDNPVVNHEKPERSLEKRIYGRINEVGAKVRFDKQETSVERGHNSKESVICEGIIFQVSHERSMELLAEDGMLDENGQIRKDRELPVDGKVYSLFMDTYRFACERFGTDNIVGAYIHLDEYTPHMHVFVVPVTMKESRYAGKVRLDEHGKPIMKGVLDAKNIFSPTTIKQLWADYARCLEKYGVSKAEGKVPKGMYTEVATMDAVINQKQSQIDELSELIVKGKGDYEEMEKRMSEASGAIGELEELMLGFDKFNSRKSELMDDMTQMVVASTLFPPLADWEVVKRVDENSWIINNSRSMSSVWLSFTPSGIYVSEWVKTGKVDDRGMYVFEWSKDQKYTDYLKSCPKGFGDMGRVGVSDKYIRHLVMFSHMVKSNHSFADVMGVAAQVSPSLRYYLLKEYCRRNAGNLPQHVKDHCMAINKEIKEVILFPKESRGNRNQQKRG